MNIIMRDKKRIRNRGYILKLYSVILDIYVELDERIRRYIVR